MSAISSEDNLSKLFEILSREPTLDQLEEILEEMGFQRSIAQKLLNDREYLLKSIDLLGKKLGETHFEIIRSEANSIKSWLRKGIVDDTHNLLSLIFLSSNPDVLRFLERKWKLPVTGDLNSLMENFREKYYTRRCEQYHTNGDFCFRGAAQAGHIDMIEKMMDSYSDYNGAMLWATSAGHKEIVELMMKNGANNYGWAMIAAARGGYLDIVELMMKYGATEFNYSAAQAARKGHKEIVELMLKHGANNYNKIVLKATTGDHLDIVKMMLDKEVDNYGPILVEASRKGHFDIIEFMFNHYKFQNYDIRNAMSEADQYGHDDLVKYLKSKLN